MPQPVIVVEGVSKAYQLGEGFSPNGSIREQLAASFKNTFKRLKSTGATNTAEDQNFWALRDVSFTVQPGEIVGLVGRNGAGKSTMLKILSRITKPSEGRVTLRGRVGSLLEVGTGFHPDLTGRENIFLNGAILGMTRAEILSKFDAIVSFAEIEKFLETPVKRYSSGMYVRLAFAVAAHLEPEILIVDEVLAVGDSEFQRKCLGRMEELKSSEGRTIFLVSHNLEMIDSLCTRSVLLEKGRVLVDGTTQSVLERYRSLGGKNSEIIITNTPHLQWLGIRNREALRGLRADGDISFDLSFRSGARPLDKLHVDCELVDSNGRRATHSKSRFVSPGFSLRANEDAIFSFTLKSPMLAPGKYFMVVYAYEPSGCVLWVEHVDACDISAKSYFACVDFIDEIKGVTVPQFTIEMKPS